MTDLEFTSSSVGIEGLKKLGEGRQAEVFIWPRGGVVKLYRSLDDFASARAEVAALRAGQAAGIPMPRLLDTVSIEQRPGVVMERLGGSDHLTLFGRKRAWEGAGAKPPAGVAVLSYSNTGESA